MKELWLRFLCWLDCVDYEPPYDEPGFVWWYTVHVMDGYVNGSPARKYREFRRSLL